MGFRGCSAKWGECGDAATTIDMQPLQQRIGFLSLANGKRNSLLACPCFPTQASSIRQAAEMARDVR